jgi:carboxymethylenebutenolidase
MPEEIKKLVEEYKDGLISRRDFIQKAIVVTGSLAAASSLFDSLGLKSLTYAAQVDPNDSGLTSTTVQFPGPGGTISGYLTKPKAAGKYPAIIVIHENRGINDHIRDVARRLAKEGFVALAPDFLSRKGGTPKVNPKDEGLSNISELAPPGAVAEDVGAAATYLKGLADVRGDRIGLTGFCWGGQQAFNSATQVRGLKAVVVYYGRTPNPPELLEKIEAPVMAHYGGEDKPISDTVPTTEAAMKKFNKSYTYKIYPGAKHAFNNDTNADRYNPDAAKEAWGKTVEFFKKNLQS